MARRGTAVQLEIVRLFILLFGFKLCLARAATGPAAPGVGGPAAAAWNSTKCEAALAAVCTRPPPSQPWDIVQACLLCVEKHPAATTKGECNRTAAVSFCYTAPPPDPPAPPPPVLPNEPTKATVSIDLGLQSAPMNELTMGCHSDSGFAHQPRALYSQMIMGESFEAQDIDGDAPLDPETGGSIGGTWPNPVLAPGAVGTAIIVASDREAFHGLQAQQLTLVSGGYVGVANRGLGNEGMVFKAGHAYDGYIWAKAMASVPMTMEVALEDHTGSSPVVLASQTLQLPAEDRASAAPWTQLHFKLTPSRSTNCDGIANAEAWSQYRVSCPINNTYSGGTAATGILSDDSAHICVRCAGQFRISLNSVGSALIDYAFLQPGPWARLNNSDGNALPVLRDGPETMARMGVTLYRLGGSYTKELAQTNMSGTTDGDYSWKHWRGAPWNRSSVGVGWRDSRYTGWGIFEAMDLTAAMGWENVMTLYGHDSPQDYADLVEYCWGNETTRWGKLRHADGHPAEYQLSRVEIGNEEYNAEFGAEALAMEEKAAQLGRPNQLFFIFPAKRSSYPDTVMQKQLAQMTAKLGDHMVVDQHVHWASVTQPSHSRGFPNGNQNDTARMEMLALLSTGWNTGIYWAQQVWKVDNLSTWGSTNLETNVGDHTMYRALIEAIDLATWSNFAWQSPRNASRLHARTASFCMERSGYQEGGMNDQGLIFFLPNATWMQPPAWAHAMIHDSWQPHALPIQVALARQQDSEEHMWVDGHTIPSGTVAGTVSVSAQISSNRSVIALRVTNFGIHPATLNVDIKPTSAVSFSLEGATVRCWQLSASKLTDANTPGQPDKIVPKDIGAVPLTPLVVAPFSFTSCTVWKSVQ